MTCNVPFSITSFQNHQKNNSFKILVRASNININALPFSLSPLIFFIMEQEVIFFEGPVGMAVGTYFSSWNKKSYSLRVSKNGSCHTSSYFIVANKIGLSFNVESWLSMRVILWYRTVLFGTHLHFLTDKNKPRVSFENGCEWKKKKSKGEENGRSGSSLTGPVDFSFWI